LDISRRELGHELMDEPGLDAREHVAALRALARLNRVSDSAGILWGPIRDLAATPGHGPVRVLDIATGSGDVPVALARRAARAGVAIEIDGCDISERALERARARADGAGLSSRFFRIDALKDELPDGYDVVMSSLFMHHLSEEDVVSLLYKMRCGARRLVLVNDLRRTRAGLALAFAASRLFSRSRVVHVDAVLSAKAAFTIPEFASLAHEAGLDGATISRCIPMRFLMRWSRP
jgi:SAM-dependent methyltransferase